MSFRILRRSRHSRSGFSLIEVVIAVGIFAVAVISIIGLLLPNTQAVNEQIEADVARRLAENVQAELQRHARSVAYAQRTSSRKGLDDFDNLFFIGAPANRTNSLFLVATRDGSRVLITGEDPYAAWNDTYKNPYKPDDVYNYSVVPAADKLAAENNLVTHATPGNPAGIAFRDRYYLIEAYLPQAPAYPKTETLADTAALPYIPVGVRVVWPYRLPDGIANPNGSSDYNSRGTSANPELPWQVVSPAKHSVLNFNLTIFP
jgi:type II secretory pathway pseudopilin PulG